MTIMSFDIFFHCQSWNYLSRLLIGTLFIFFFGVTIKFDLTFFGESTHDVIVHFYKIWILVNVRQLTHSKLKNDIFISWAWNYQPLFMIKLFPVVLTEKN